MGDSLIIAFQTWKKIDTPEGPGDFDVIDEKDNLTLEEAASLAEDAVFDTDPDSVFMPIDWTPDDARTDAREELRADRIWSWQINETTEFIVKPMES